MLKDLPDIPSEWIDTLVEVSFLDHGWGDDSTGLIECRIWGLFIHADEKQVTIQVWEADRSPSENAEYAVLVRAAITNVRRLEYVGDE